MFSSTPHLKKLGAFDVTASLMLSEVGTDMHTQKKAAESFHCEITPQIPLTIFVSRKYVHEGRAQRTRAILAETGAGAETEVRL